MTVDGKTIGIALSGGGFRATLFGLGSLWRLNDAGLLGRLDRVTSVSGGSIVAGVLAHRWKELAFAEGSASNFADVVASPVRRFCSRTIDVSAAIRGMLNPFKSAGAYLADAYRKHLFGDSTLRTLPAATDGAPKFTFYATNMQTGRSFRFRQDMIADYVLGTSSFIDVPLATAVAASSAFPPFFSPIVLKTDPTTWKDANTALADLPKLRRKIVLADGGVYDNMGLESLVENVDIVLASDAGAPFEVKASPLMLSVFQLGRVRDILIDQTRALRKRWLMSELRSGRMRGGYWGIATRIDEYEAPSALATDNEVTGGLDAIPTRLRAFSDRDQGLLINWGYALADAALRTRAALSIPAASACPVANCPLRAG